MKKLLKIGTSNMKKLTLIALIALSIFACKKEEDVKPQPRVKTVTTTQPDTTMAANEEFIGNWIGGKLCGNWTSVNITAGRNDTIVMVYGMVECKISEGKFQGYAGTVWHTGEIVDGRLVYCQKSSGVSCCGSFEKE